MSLSPRSNFLLVVGKDDGDFLLELMEQHNSKSSYFNLEEILPALSKVQLEEIWKTLYCISEKYIVNALASGNNDNAEMLCSEQESEKAVKVINAIISLAKMVITLNLYIPEQLVQYVVLMHGILLGFSDKQDQIKNKISQLCELWFSKNLEEKDAICTNTVIYLLQRSLAPKAMKNDIKRIWNMHESLPVTLNKDDENKDAIMTFLEKCAVSQVYLNTKEGIKFISFLFKLNVKFIETLHKTIKTHLPNCSYKQAEQYGKIYFRAWLNSTGIIKEKLEIYCIQDFMYYAVHLPRKIPRSLSSLLKKLLNFFHHHRKQNDVAVMLLNLYDPIIWRSLKVANGVVRANAADLFFAVYPLGNPEANVEETDEMLQKQFNLIQSLLKDPSPEVRSIAIIGTCTILNQHWEDIPHEVIKELIRLLINELAFDASSADVRASVFKGLKVLLDNPLTHPTLKNILPALQNCFHDIAERVRIAFCNLLLKIKQLRTLKYWEIVPIEHLMARLEIDNKSVVRHIVNIIHSSYIPVSKPALVQLQRCLILIKEYRAASRVFFQYVHQYIGLEATVNCIILLGKGIYLYAKKTLNSLNDSPPSITEIHPRIQNTENKENFSIISTESLSVISDSEDSRNDLPFDDPEVSIGVLDAMSIMWSGINNKLHEPKNKEQLKLLIANLQGYITTLYKFYKDNDAFDSLIYLSSFFPSSSVPTFTGQCFNRLKKQPENSNPSDFSNVLESLCNHGRAADILELVSDWISYGLKENPNEISQRELKLQTKKRVKFVEVDKPKPTLALIFLEGLLQLPVCRERILNYQTSILIYIKNQLSSVKNLLERRFSRKQYLTHCSDEFLLKSFILHNKLILLLHNDKQNEINAPKIIEDLIYWLSEEPLQELKNLCQDEDSLTEEEIQLRNLKFACIENLLQVCIDTILIGFGENNFCLLVSKFASSLIEIANSSEKLLKLISKIIYQLVEYLLLNEENFEHNNCVSELISKILQLIASRNQHSSEESTKALKVIMPAISESLIYFSKRNIFNAEFENIIVILMSAIIAEITMYINKHQTFDECEKIIQLPSISSALITVLIYEKKLIRMFLCKLIECLESDNLSEPSSILATVHLLNTLYKDRLLCKLQISDFREIITTVNVILEKMNTDDKINESDDDSFNVDKIYIKNAKSLVNELKTSVG